MAQRLGNDIVESLRRAEGDGKEAVVRRRRASASSPTNLYGGASAATGSEHLAEDQHRSRPAAVPRTRRSTFNMIRWLFVAAIAIVLYISNILTVRRLAVEVYQLQVEYSKIQSVNSVLQAEVNRKSGWDRIGSIAAQGGLVHATRKPQHLEIEEKRWDEFKGK